MAWSFVWDCYIVKRGKGGRIVGMGYGSEMLSGFFISDEVLLKGRELTIAVK